LRSANHLFCVNRDQQAYALSLFPDAEQRQLRARTSVLPMGVNPPSAIDKGGETYVFGTVSRLSKKKGLHHLLAAANALADRGFAPPIGIAGDGEDAHELKRLAHQANVDFPGFLTGERKDEFLERTRVFVMPSVASGDDVEGMPVALLEALCRGKPVVAGRDTNIAMLPEWPSIRSRVQLVDDPADTAALATALNAAAAAGGASERENSRQVRSVMARYLWPNLINEYLAALDLCPRSNAEDRSPAIGVAH
jgi:glycosyltransferase involved in cell wall biosynthesis